MRLVWAVASDAGRRRVNEDSYAARPELGLFVVADGMGGHAAGEVASKLAVDAIEEFIGDTSGVGPRDTWPFPDEPGLGVEGNRLKSAFRLANRRIAESAAQARVRQGMATTATAVLIGDTAAVAHVGDSRVYRLRRGALERLTQDHSWVEEQVRAGALSAGAARVHPWRNVVTRALGGGEDADVDVRTLVLQPGDRVMLCSDGLSSMLTDERLGELLGQPIANGDLAPICQALVAEANREGGPDNITVLVLQIDAP